MANISDVQSDDVQSDASWQVKESAVETYAPESVAVGEAARRNLDDPEALYRSLVRSLKRRKGFGILFVQCTPAKAQEIFPRLEKDLSSKKKIARLTLTEPVGNLFKIIGAREDINNINALFIEGIDKSLAPYIKSEVGRNDYYKLEVLPPVLFYLNRLRENFLQEFPHLCLIFVVPPFALKYFMYRAIDFFSWNSGVWRFHPDDNQIKQETQKALSEEFSQYEALSEEDVQRKIVELQDLIDVEVQTDKRKSDLLEKQGLLLTASEEWSVALRCFERASELSPPSVWNWYFRGLVLSHFGDYEEAIANYTAALAIQPDYYEVLYHRGFSLSKLGRYEEAIASYDAVLAIKPNHHKALNRRGFALGALGRYEEAVLSFDSALAIKPDYYEALRNKGPALGGLCRYKETLDCYEEVLRINPNDHRALESKALVLGILRRYKEAVTSLDSALKVKPDDHNLIHSKGLVLGVLGHYEEAIANYDAVLAINSDDYETLNDKGKTLSTLGRYGEAIASYDLALKIQPDYASTCYNKACAYALSAQPEKALTSLQETIELDSTDKYIEMAKTDSDFDSIRSHPQFQALILSA